MSSSIEVVWEVDADQMSRDEAKKVLDEIEQQIEFETGDEIQILEGEELDPGTGTVLISFFVSVGSDVVGRAIYDGLKNLKGTEKVETDADQDQEGNITVEVENNGDGDVTVNIEK